MLFSLHVKQTIRKINPFKCFPKPLEIFAHPIKCFEEPLTSRSSAISFFPFSFCIRVRFPGEGHICEVLMIITI